MVGKILTAAGLGGLVALGVLSVVAIFMAGDVPGLLLALYALVWLVGAVIGGLATWFCSLAHTGTNENYEQVH